MPAGNSNVLIALRMECKAGQASLVKARLPGREWCVTAAGALTACVEAAVVVMTGSE